MVSSTDPERTSSQTRSRSPRLTISHSRDGPPSTWTPPRRARQQRCPGVHVHAQAALALVSASEVIKSYPSPGPSRGGTRTNTHSDSESATRRDSHQTRCCPSAHHTPGQQTQQASPCLQQPRGTVPPRKEARSRPRSGASPALSCQGGAGRLSLRLSSGKRQAAPSHSLLPSLGRESRS